MKKGNIVMPLMGKITWILNPSGKLRLRKYGEQVVNQIGKAKPKTKGIRGTMNFLDFDSVSMLNSLSVID